MRILNDRFLPVRLLQIEEDLLRFSFFDEGKLKNEITIQAGSDYVCKQYFKGDVPKDDEVEISIYYVEETALSNKALMNEKESLVCNHKLLPEIFGKKLGDVISFAEIEAVNLDYFDYIAGVPASVLHLDFSKEKFTIVLILRAIMHVLKFKDIQIAK
ncbi:hypothetical protein BZG02_13670 [Labilibaculum filiforme]|uniref:Uncharacterized protein n=1 Tax=Labilibaculum filiforme TaxID=1940526 RepID=A0A2N3HVB9_9BACT|nr:hypothetical protein [Labilibaculum filiforme]PKQ61983.1 hypothetical protein BZG02_13670 [Labilibaculum filiforme]